MGDEVQILKLQKILSGSHRHLLELRPHQGCTAIATHWHHLQGYDGYMVPFFSYLSIISTIVDLQINKTGLEGKIINLSRFLPVLLETNFQMLYWHVLSHKISTVSIQTVIIENLS